MYHLQRLSKDEPALISRRQNALFLKNICVSPDNSHKKSDLKIYVHQCLLTPSKPHCNFAKNLALVKVIFRKRVPFSS